MATLISLRRRIRAAQNISKTTRAFQMIAASRLKKAQEATFASRPYVKKVSDLASTLTALTADDEKHPYMHFVSGDQKKTLLLALSPDKGLCGGLITNLLKQFYTYTREDKDLSYIVVGKKIEAQVVKLNQDIIAAFPFGTTLPTFDMVYPIVKLIDEYYLSGKVQTVKILYTDFTSFFSQTPKIATILPISLPEEENNQASFEVFEPNLPEMLPSLLKHYLEMSLYQYLLESYLSEQASRMLAMQNATNNAKEMMEELKLEYNKTRQGKITSELLDITGGRAQAS